MPAYFNYYCDSDELCFVDLGFTGPSGMKLYQREPTASGYLSEFYGAPEGAPGEGVIFRLKRWQEGDFYYQWEIFRSDAVELFAYSSVKNGGTGDFFSACPITTNINPQDGFTFYSTYNQSPYDITITYELCGSSVTPTPTPTLNATPTPTTTPTPTPTPGITGSVCNLNEICVTITGVGFDHFAQTYSNYPSGSGANWLQLNAVQEYNWNSQPSDFPLFCRYEPNSGYFWQFFHGDGLFRSQMFPEVVCPISVDNSGQCVYSWVEGSSPLSLDYMNTKLSVYGEQCANEPTPTPTPTPTATPTPTITPTPTPTPTATPTPTSDPGLKKAFYLEFQNRGESPYYKVDTTLESVCSTFLKQYQNSGGFSMCFWVDSNDINKGAYVYSRDPSNGDCSQVRSKAYPMPDGYYRMLTFEDDYSYQNLIIRVRNSRIIEKFEGPCYKKIKPYRLFWKNTKDIILTRDKNGVLSNFKMQEGNSLAETNLIDMDAGLEYIDPVTKLRIVAPVKPKIKLVKRALANGNINTNIISDSDASNSMELDRDPALTAMTSGYGEIINRNLYPNISNDLNRSVTNRYVLTFDGDDDFDPCRSSYDKIVRVIDSEYLFTLPRCVRVARDVLQYELRLPYMLNMQGVWKPADNSIIATNNKLYYDRIATSSYDLTDYALSDRKFIKVLLKKTTTSRSQSIRVQCDPCYLGINTQLGSQVLNLKFCLKNSTVEIPVTITIAKN